MRRTSVDVFREHLRMQQVYNVLLRYGYDATLNQSELLGRARHSMQSWVCGLPKGWERPSTAVTLRLMLEELGAPPEEIFASFEPQPFAAASTAQVHRATLDDGTAVAVKIQRPNIERMIRADIGIMGNAARVASRRSASVRAMGIGGMVEQFGTGVLDELDYRGEAYNALRLAENMKDLPGVHVPTVCTEFSTSKVITQEFIRGVKISDVEALDRAGLDREELARNALRALIKQLTIDGFFHADPHPGNILVSLHTGTITFIDLGMLGELDLRQQRLRIGQLMLAMQQHNVEGMARVLYGLSTPFAGAVDTKAYYRDSNRRIGRYMSGQEASFGQIANEGFDLLRTHGLRPDPNLTLAVKALVQTESVADALSAGDSLIAEGVPMLREMALEAITGDAIVGEAKKQVMTLAGDVIERVPTFTEATTKWLDQYQKGRFEVTIDTSELAKEVDKLSRLGRQVVIAIMLVGMLIGSAIAAYGIAAIELTGGVWDLMARIAPLGFVVSLVLTFLIVLRLVWRWLRHKSAEED